MKNKRNLFLIALVIPILLLLSLTWKPLWTLNTGTPIVLETIPVDPRDILYGDYVSLQFAVEEFKEDVIEPELLKDLKKQSFGKIVVYAVLQKEHGDLYGLKSVTAEKPDSGIFLEGQMYRYGDSIVGEEITYYADFLPDRFYVPENTGQRLENLSRKGKLIAKMKVYNGYTVLQDIQPK
ncbi:GDYXXLXY domain-containing protein [Sporosarcina sp.]|uniref:GDYXXLXY domain-containing protein n=1 Tax=Sporosarcina sp. TaxID=49982 RepID=UPI00263A03B2|nr:GDYXXLXY domain-containing protein [Sporosarcina sp.]